MPRISFEGVEDLIGGGGPDTTRKGLRRVSFEGVEDFLSTPAPISTPTSIPLKPQQPRITNPLNVAQDVRPDASGGIRPRSVPTSPSFGPPSVRPPPMPQLAPVAAQPSSTGVAPPEVRRSPTEVEVPDIPGVPSEYQAIAKRVVLGVIGPGIPISEYLLNVTVKRPEVKGLIQKAIAGGAELGGQLPALTVASAVAGGPAATIARTAGAGSILSSAAHSAATLGAMGTLPRSGEEYTPENVARNVAVGALEGTAFGMAGGLPRRIMPKPSRIAEVISQAAPAAGIAAAHGGTTEDVIIETGLNALLPILHGRRPQDASLRARIERAAQNRDITELRRISLETDAGRPPERPIEHTTTPQAGQEIPIRNAPPLPVATEEQVTGLSNPLNARKIEDAQVREAEAARPSAPTAEVGPAGEVPPVAPPPATTAEKPPVAKTGRVEVGEAPVPAEVAKPENRQAWEMTYAEVLKAVNPSTREELQRSRPVLRELYADKLANPADPWGLIRAIERGNELPRTPTVDLSKRHRESIRAALSEGKPVPPAVLADYPDLAAKYGPEKVKPVSETPGLGEGERAEVAKPENRQAWEMTREEFEKQPNVMWRGDTVEEIRHSLKNEGIYFASDKKYATEYGELFAAILRVQNPFDAQKGDFGKLVAAAQQVADAAETDFSQKRGPYPSWQHDLLDKLESAYDLAVKDQDPAPMLRALGATGTEFGSEKFSSILRAAGYDGLIMDYGKGKVVAIIDPSQGTTHRSAVESALSGARGGGGGSRACGGR